MDWTRRKFLQFSSASALSLAASPTFGQGVASHKAKPLARQAPSGRPFHAHFVDVAQAAGLLPPILYGGASSNKYSIESTGCGCALPDCDHHRRMGLFPARGT